MLYFKLSENKICTDTGANCMKIQFDNREAFARSCRRNDRRDPSAQYVTDFCREGCADMVKVGKPACKSFDCSGLLCPDFSEPVLFRF